MGWKDAPAVGGSWKDAPVVDYNPSSSFYENLKAGAGKAVVDAGRGLRQIASNVPLLNELDTFNPEKVQAEIDESRKLDAPLMRTGGGVTGNILGNVAMTAAVPVGGSVGGAAAIGAGLGAVQPVAEGESRLANTAIGAVAGAGGKVVGDKAAQMIGTRLANKFNQAEAAAASNAERDATLMAGRELGLSVAPSSVNPTLKNNIIESIAGKRATEQMLSRKNQTVVDDVFKRYLGLPENAQLNEATLNAVRSEAGKAYEVVESLPRVLWDKEFERGVSSLARNKLGGATSNPADDAINGLISELRSNPAWSGKGLVSDIRNLREMGKANIASAERAGGDVGKDALGKAQMKAAGLLEDLAERNLSLNGAPSNTIENMREARKLIAKTYTVEKSMLEGTGNVSAQKIAKEFNKGVPLDGEAETVARFANQFKQVVNTPSQIGSPEIATLRAHLGSIGGGAVGGMLGGVYGFGAGVVAPWAIRRGIGTDVAQRALASPSYGPSSMLRLSDLVARNPAVRAAIPGASAAGGLTLRDLVQQ